jgi:geranylgeranyl diphosphate synthase type II
MEPRHYLYDLAADYPSRGGKMMRPSLCIATARAFGGRLEDALLPAVAIELLHNALLIHDDFEDGSEERRGRETLHVLHGAPLAINAGDALLMLAMRPLLDGRERLGADLTLRIMETTERMARESAEGQALELGWRRHNVNTLVDADYLQMVLKKTCWLGMIYPCRVGALLGSGASASIPLERFIRFGFFLGVAFQIQDDLLNLVADSRYGKEPDGDLWEGKRTLMLIHLYRQLSSAEQATLSDLLGRERHERGLEDVLWMREHMERHGSIDYARKMAHGLAGAALHEFWQLFGELPESSDRDFVEGLTTWVFERTAA